MTIRKITIYGLLSALTIAISFLLTIPIPATNGMITPIEIGIYLSALLLGPTGGLLIGGISGLTIDLLTGYSQWAPFSLVIHGLQGLIVGYLAFKFVKQNKISWLILASLWMICGYFLASWYLFDWTIAVASIFNNLIQSILGIVVTSLIYPRIKRINLLN